jgi:hypothetical protein
MRKSPPWRLVWLNREPRQLARNSCEAPAFRALPHLLEMDFFHDVLRLKFHQ